MKFKFCGNIDCPEWLISEITYLTKISSIKLRIICNNLVSSFISVGKTLKDILKSIEDMNFSEEEAIIIISSLEFIIKNSTKFDVEDIILNQELQQLGLPQENADSITKVFKNQKENLKKKLSQETFTLNRLANIDYKISYVLANNYSNYDHKIIKSEEFNFEMDDNLNEIHKINNLDAKINFCFDFIKPEDETTSNSRNGLNEFHFTTNKELLGKLINDLEKCSQQIKKYKDNF
jgi:hypothetical protein